MLQLTETDITDVSDIKPWCGWCPIDKCKLCHKGPFSTTFEFTYNVNDGEDIYISEGCQACTKILTDHDPVYCSREHWVKARADGKNTYDVYLRYGIINNFHLD
jgi:hypothetical protein